MAKKSLKQRIDEVLNEGGDTFGETIKSQLRSIEQEHGVLFPGLLEAGIDQVTPEDVRSYVKGEANDNRAAGALTLLAHGGVDTYTDVWNVLPAGVNVDDQDPRYTEMPDDTDWENDPNLEAAVDEASRVVLEWAGVSAEAVELRIAREAD